MPEKEQAAAGTVRHCMIVNAFVENVYMGTVFVSLHVSLSYAVF